MAANSARADVGLSPPCSAGLGDGYPASQRNRLENDCCSKLPWSSVLGTRDRGGWNRSLLPGETTRRCCLQSMLPPCTKGGESTGLEGALVLCQKRIVVLVGVGSRS